MFSKVLKKGFVVNVKERLCFYDLIQFYNPKLRKAFSKFYRRYYETISKFNVGLKSLLHQGLSETEFYGDLVYTFKKIMIMGRTDFSDQLRQKIVRHKRIGYNLNVMRQSACLVINPITVDNFAALLDYTPVDRASDPIVCCLVHWGSTDLLLLEIFSCVVWQTRDLHLSHNTLYLLSPRLCFFIVLKQYNTIQYK